jgi:hypothetical protein
MATLFSLRHRDSGLRVTLATEDEVDGLRATIRVEDDSRRLCTIRGAGATIDAVGDVIAWATARFSEADGWFELKEE